MCEKESFKSKRLRIGNARGGRVEFTRDKTVSHVEYMFFPMKDQYFVSAFQEIMLARAIIFFLFFSLKKRYFEIVRSASYDSPQRI